MQPSTAEGSERPYGQNHDWEASRYAGVFPILLVLLSKWRWLHRLMGLFGTGWRLFMEQETRDRP